MLYVLNAIYPNLSFTSEFQVNYRLPFLDVLVSHVEGEAVAFVNQPQLVYT